MSNIKYPVKQMVLEIRQRMNDSVGQRKYNPDLFQWMREPPSFDQTIPQNVRMSRMVHGAVHTAFDPGAVEQARTIISQLAPSPERRTGSIFRSLDLLRDSNDEVTERFIRHINNLRTRVENLGDAYLSPYSKIESHRTGFYLDHTLKTLEIMLATHLTNAKQNKEIVLGKQPTGTPLQPTIAPHHFNKIFKHLPGHLINLISSANRNLPGPKTLPTDRDTTEMGVPTKAEFLALGRSIPPKKTNQDKPTMSVPTTDTLNPGHLPPGIAPHHIAPGDIPLSDWLGRGR